MYKIYIWIRNIKHYVKQAKNEQKNYIFYAQTKFAKNI